MLTDINERVDPSQKMVGLKSVVESVRTVMEKLLLKLVTTLVASQIMPTVEVTGG